MSDQASELGGKLFPPFKRVICHRPQRVENQSPKMEKSRIEKRFFGKVPVEHSRMLVSLT
jgi:hypothetical protein